MRLSIFPKFHRTPIERAFVSEQVNRRAGRTGLHGLKQNGRLLKRWPEARYTRVSAALFLTEQEEGGEVTPAALIIHNPTRKFPCRAICGLASPSFFSMEKMRERRDGDQIRHATNRQCSSRLFRQPRFAEGLAERGGKSRCAIHPGKLFAVTKSRLQLQHARRGRFCLVHPAKLHQWSCQQHT